jgi:dihydrodipicolinate synthase/N-acetylneuraminate lyase
MALSSTYTAVADAIGIKDTGGDAVAATELIQTDGPTLLNGWDTLTFAALAAGVRAVVWGTASILPVQCVELHRLLIDDIDLPAARELWARLWPLCRFLERPELPRPRSRPAVGWPATPRAPSGLRCCRSTTRRPASSPRCWLAHRARFSSPAST